MGAVREVYDRPYSPEAAAKLIDESRRMMRVVDVIKLPPCPGNDALWCSVYRLQGQLCPHCPRVWGDEKP